MAFGKKLHQALLAGREAEDHGGCGEALLDLSFIVKADHDSAVNRLDGMTQQNAALVEQSAAAAEQLSLQARSLTDLVAKFRLSAVDKA